MAWEERALLPVAWGEIPRSRVATVEQAPPSAAAEAPRHRRAAVEGPPDRSGFVEPNPPDTGAVATDWGDQFDAIGATYWADYSASLGPRCAAQ